MAHGQQVFLLFFGWSYICGGYCVMLKDHFAGLKRNKEWHNISKTGGRNHPTEQNDLILHDTVSEHMRMLYEKYNREGFHFEDGNTVRSFKAHSGNINNNQLQIFNLSSLTKSEDILSVTLHYHLGELQNNSHRCAGPRTFGCQLVHFSIWSFASPNNSTNSEGHFLTNVTTMYRDGMSWQWKDITHAISQARHHSELLIGIYANTDGQRTHKTLLPDGSIYALVHANDLAISESESVMSTLRRHTGALVQRPHRLSMDTLNTTAKFRARRSTNGLLPLQNNELPGPEHPHRAPSREGESPLYEATEDRTPVKRSRAKLRRQQQDHRMALLRFDEQTMKKARKRQWSEPRHCARRYLKVDFADIGWNEWIISPKYFEAFYCSGSCQFPVPKSVKSSNHATIQSIVRAVGVVPGIPEPCCVPEKMSSLSVLFLDENHNVVLKNYPNMTVDSCACQ